MSKHRPARFRSVSVAFAAERESAPSSWTLMVWTEAVAQTPAAGAKLYEIDTARFWRGSNQSTQAVDCREAALHDLGLETAGARLWLFHKAIPLCDSLA
jgi:hypothetical protein